MSRILRLLAIFCVTLFVGSAFAATGYVCDEDRVYTACATGYYMVNGSESFDWDESGNWCQPCSSPGNTATFCPGGLDAPLYAVTLSMNDGTGDNFRTIYASETLGWYTGTTGTSVGTSISSLSSIPTRAPTTSGANTTTYTFNGFYTSATGGTQWIDATGKFVDNTLYESVYAPKTLYARWSEETSTGCPAGYYVNGGNCTACPAGKYQPNNGSDATACEPCGAGKWSEDGASSCSNISAGCYGTNGETSCPYVCDNGYYSPAGASACTKCTGNYTNSGDNAADHAFQRSCQIKCDPGYAVVVPGGNCVTSEGFGTGVFFTSPSVRTVAWGDITPFSFCPVPYSSGNDRYTQGAACVAGNAAAGKVVTATPMVKYIKFSMVDNTTQTLYLVEVMPRSQNGDPITVEYSQEYSSTSGITYPIRAVDGVYKSSDVVVGGGLISNKTTLSGVNLEYTVKLPGDGVPVASVDIIFNPSYLYQSINYVISTSMDGETWTPIYSTQTASSGTLAARMYSSSASSAAMLLTRRFLLYGETSSPAGSFAPARYIYLVPGNSSLGSTACPTGSYTNAVGQSACVPCQNGTTTSAAGATSCNATCANNANVDIWKTAEWSNNTVSNVCTITACDSTYVLNNNVCSACACTKGVDATSCTVTGTSANNECQFSFACATGYETASGATSGKFTGVPGSVNNLLTACNAKCVKVTLNPGHDLSESVIYSKYNDKTTWYSDETCSTKTTTTNVAVRPDYVLAGYWAPTINAEALEDIEQDTSLPASASGLLRIAPPTLESMLSEVSSLTLPSAYVGGLTADETWYARWARKCEAGTGALCSGPYYYQKDDTAGTREVEYINCCLPGYNKAGMSVSPDGTICPTDS